MLQPLICTSSMSPDLNRTSVEKRSHTHIADLIMYYSIIQDIMQEIFYKVKISTKIYACRVRVWMLCFKLLCVNDNGTLPLFSMSISFSEYCSAPYHTRTWGTLKTKNINCQKKKHSIWTFYMESCSCKYLDTWLIKININFDAYFFPIMWLPIVRLRHYAMRIRL